MGKQKIKQKTFFVFKKIATIVATVTTIVATSNYNFFLKPCKYFFRTKKSKKKKFPRVLKYFFIV